MNKLLALTAAATAIVAAAPASATSFTFATTNGGTTTSSSDYGNARTYQAVNGAETLNVKATAWSIGTNNIVSNAKLVSYSAGLGVINRNETGALNTHTTDNLNGEDFILLQFSQAVSLTSAILNPYSVYFDKADNDSTVGWGTLQGAWNQALALNGISESSLGKMFTGTINIASNGAATQSYSIKGAGNLWMIGASVANPDCYTDGFKLAGVTVSSVAAVPEPATWAMMLVGFGMVAATSRYRRRGTKIAYA